MKRPRATAAAFAPILAVAWAAAAGPLPAQVPAQTPDPAPRGGIRLEAGVTRHGQTDLMASPLRYRGTAPMVGFVHRWVRQETRFQIAGYFSAPGLESRITGEWSREDAYLGALRVRWLRSVARRTVHSLDWEGFLGVRADLRVAMRWHRYPPGGQRELFGDVFVPIQAAAAHELRLAPRTVAWQSLSVPVAALVLRSPYTGLKYAPTPRLVPPGRLLGFDHTLGVDRALGSRWSWVAAWRFSVLHYPDPRDLTLVHHQWTLALEVRP